MPKTLPPVIIGGGLAGLTAAWHLAARGMAPILLEAHPDHFGGRLRSTEPARFEFDGRAWEFSAEHAVHGFWANYTNLFELLESARIPVAWRPAQEETWVHRRNGHVLQSPAGRALRTGLMPAPLHYLHLFLQPAFWQMLSPADLLRLPAVLYSLFLVVAVDPLAGDAPLRGRRLAELIRHWGPNIRDFLIGLSRSGLSATPDQIPLSGFVAFLRFYSARSKRHWAFRYLSTGAPRALLEPLLSSLRALGTDLRLNATATNISPTPSGWVVDTPQGPVSTTNLILALDAPNARVLLNRSKLKIDSPGSLAWPAAMAPAVVRVWFRKSPESGAEAGIFTGDFVLDNFFWLHELYDEYRAWHTATGGSVLETHIYGPAETLAKSDAVLLTAAIHDLRMAFPQLSNQRVHQSLTRLEPTHTVYEVSPSLPAVSSTGYPPGLYLAGDWVQYPHPALFMERAVVTGKAAANQVLTRVGLPTFSISPPLSAEPSAILLERSLQAGARFLSRRR